IVVQIFFHIPSLIYCLISSFGGEFQRKLAEFPAFSFYGDLSFELLNDPIADAQAKSHAFADVLGREEGIENLVQMFGFDALAVVTNQQQAASVFNAAV